MREVDDQNAVRACDSDQHQYTHEGHHVQRRSRQKEDYHNSGETHGDRQHDQYGVYERPELRDQNEIEQKKRQAEADPKTAERLLHAEYHAPKIHPHIRRMRNRVDDVLNRGCYFTQVFALRRHINLCRALYVVLVDFGRAEEIYQLDNRVQSRRLFEFRRLQRYVSEIERRMDRGRPFFVILNSEEIIISGRLVGPVVGRDHGVRVQGRDYIVDNVLLGQAEFSRMYPVHFHAQGRIVHILRNVYLTHIVQM